MPTNNADVKFQYMSLADYTSAPKDDNTFYVVQDPWGRRFMYLGTTILNQSTPYNKVLAASGTLVFSGSGTQYIDIDSQYWNFTNLKLVVSITGGTIPEIVTQTYEDIRMIPMNYTGADGGAGPAVLVMNTQTGNERIQVHAMNQIDEVRYWVYAENYEV